MLYEVITANYILRCAVLPAGEHKVEFKFEPSSFKKGQLVALLSSLFLLALIIYAVIKIKKQTV